jgi:hypothetical protein
MATVGGLRVGNAISVNQTFSTNTTTITGTVYTAPSNGYAILTVTSFSCSVGGTAVLRSFITIAGQILADTGSTSTATGRSYGPTTSNQTTSTGAAPWTMYLGPGQSIQYSAQGASGLYTGQCTFAFHGVELING